MTTPEQETSQAREASTGQFDPDDCLMQSECRLHTLIDPTDTAVHGRCIRPLADRGIFPSTVKSLALHFFSSNSESVEDDLVMLRRRSQVGRGAPAARSRTLNRS